MYVRAYKVVYRIHAMTCATCCCCCLLLGAAVSWFAVGCYYMCARQFDAARRYFGKATAAAVPGGSFGAAPVAAAWLGFGHAFAAQDERDQVRLEATGVWCRDPQRDRVAVLSRPTLESPKISGGRSRGREC